MISIFFDCMREVRSSDMCGTHASRQAVQFAAQRLILLTVALLRHPPLSTGQALRPRGQQQPDEQQCGRQRGPCSHRHEAEIRPANNEARREHDHVRIAPCRDQPEPGVERTPGEDGEPRDPQLERTLAEAPADVADEDDPVDRRQRDSADGRRVEGEPDAPGDIPERRMNEVDAVVEDVSQLGRGDGDAREFAVAQGIPVEDRKLPADMMALVA